MCSLVLWEFQYMYIEVLCLQEAYSGVLKDLLNKHMKGRNVLYPPLCCHFCQPLYVDSNFPKYRDSFSPRDLVL